MVKEDFSRTSGIDPEFKGAFPGGPPLVSEETAEAMWNDPNEYLKGFANRLKLKKLLKQEKKEGSKTEEK
jgi:hypothetical protein